MSPASLRGEGTRQRLTDLVAQRPGSSIRELADALGIRRTAVVHHLRLLGRAGTVRSVRSGRRLLVFPACANPFEGLVGLLRLRAVRRLVEVLRDEPGLSVRGAARRLGVTPRAVRYHAMRLRDLGLLRVEWSLGGRRSLLLEARALDLLGPAAAPQPLAPLVLLRPAP